MSAATTENVRVLFIAGYGRSGSTLLDRMLGEVPGFVNVGEIRYIWDRGLEENCLCGCCQPFRTCTFWKQVLAEAASRGNGVDTAEALRLHRQLLRLANVPALAVPRFGSRTSRQALNSYARIMGRVYAAIGRVSGAQVIVDSSKNPLWGFLLAGVQGVELFTVHLVRDSRAVAFSWQRKRIRPEVHWKSEYMPRHGTWQSVREWSGLNCLASSMSWRSYGYRLVRYEDLVAAPREALAKIVRFAGSEPGEMPFLEHGRVSVHRSHTVSGNPLRFAKSSLDIKLDDEWRRAMPRRSRVLVTAATWPLLLAYRYRVFN